MPENTDQKNSEYRHFLQSESAPKEKKKCVYDPFKLQRKSCLFAEVDNNF